MAPAQENSGSKGPVRPAASSVIIPGQTALDRLQQIQDSRKGIWRDFAENWPGWLFSGVFHLGLVLLSLFIVIGVPSITNRIMMETGYDNSLKQLTEEPLDELFKESLVDADIDEMPSVDANKDDTTPGYTDLDPGAPAWLTLGGHLTGLGGGGGGGHELAGKSWGGYLKSVQKSGLDVVFVFDSTGSMGGIILETKQRIRQLMTVVSYLVPDSRLGLVTYRDLREFDPAEYEYTTKAKALTQDVKGLEAFLRGVEAYGGGDQPEAIYQALEAAMHINWNQGTKKVIILFGDAPPRPENDGLNKVYQLCKQWHDKTGGQVSCIDTSNAVYETYKMMPEFQAIAEAGGGEAILLKNERDIIRQLVVYIFGSKWESEVERVYNTILKGPAEVQIIE